MILHKYKAVFCVILSLFSSAVMGAEQSEKTSTRSVLPDVSPDATEFVQVLLKNGARVEKGCDASSYGATLQDRLAYLMSPQKPATQTVITYHCINDKREARKTGEVIAVWNCNITGQGIWKNAAQTMQEEGLDVKDMDIVDGDTEIYSTSIYLYLDKKNLNIVDVTCL